VRELHNKYGGADAAIVLTPAPAAIEQAFRSVKRTGKVVLVGLVNSRFELPLVDTVLKGIHVQGSFIGSVQDLADALRLAVEGKVKPRIETHPLERAPEALERLRRGEVRGRAGIWF